jgi:hypothetical protein
MSRGLPVLESSCLSLCLFLSLNAPPPPPFPLPSLTEILSYRDPVKSCPQLMRGFRQSVSQYDSLNPKLNINERSRDIFTSVDLSPEPAEDVEEDDKEDKKQRHHQHRRRAAV